MNWNPLFYLTLTLHLLSDKELEDQLFPAHDEDVSFESRILNICPVNFKRRV